ncbi:MAG: hypothetical protein H6620_10625 [Halobacteriovoraceae bacterium]|nr:hypothetical protein [Halobacteriovoraceae bacterium]
MKYLASLFILSLTLSCASKKPSSTKEEDYLLELESQDLAQGQIQLDANIEEGSQNVQLSESEVKIDTSDLEVPSLEQLEPISTENTSSSPVTASGPEENSLEIDLTDLENDLRSGFGAVDKNTQAESATHSQISTNSAPIEPAPIPSLDHEKIEQNSNRLSRTHQQTTNSQALSSKSSVLNKVDEMIIYTPLWRLIPLSTCSKIIPNPLYPNGACVERR